jgi:ABC-type uncharacterized transport system permease subunit
MQPTKDTRQLNWFLAWAVVFCVLARWWYHAGLRRYSAYGG